MIAINYPIVWNSSWWVICIVNSVDKKPKKSNWLLFTLYTLYSTEIKQEPKEEEEITENGQVKDEDDAKEAGELVSLKLHLIQQFSTDLCMFWTEKPLSLPRVNLMKLLMKQFLGASGFKIRNFIQSKKNIDIFSIIENVDSVLLLLLAGAS